MADKDHGLGVAIVEPTNEIYKLNGRLVRGVNLVVDDEVFEQYRLGYRCLACHHFPQPEPMPERCCEDYCRFPMRRDQLRLLEFEDRGKTDRVVDGSNDDYHERRERLINNDDLWLPGL